MELRRAAGHAIKFLDSQLQRAVLIRTAAKQRSKPADRKNRLHRSFAERVLVADDYRACIILEGGRKNLAGRRALPAGQNHQRPRIGDARGWIRRNTDITIVNFRWEGR